MRVDYEQSVCERLDFFIADAKSRVKRIKQITLTASEWDTLLVELHYEPDGTSRILYRHTMIAREGTHE